MLDTGINKHNHQDWEASEMTDEDMEKLIEKEYTRLLDQDDEAVSSAICADAFDTASYRAEWPEHIKSCSDAIYDYHTNDAEGKALAIVRLGSLIISHAENYLMELARENVEDKLT